MKIIKNNPTNLRLQFRLKFLNQKTIASLCEIGYIGRPIIGYCIF